MSAEGRRRTVSRVTGVERRGGMRWLLCAAIAALSVSPAPANACFGEPVPEAVLFDRPPTHRPPGYALFKVVGRIAREDRERLFVRIVEPTQARRLGPTAWLAAEPISSCTTWGRLGSEAYVAARVAGRLRGRTLLLAAVYNRSPWDRLWNLFGWATFWAPRQPLIVDSFR